MSTPGILECPFRDDWNISLRFSDICSNVYEIHFEIKEVLIMNLYIYLQYLGGSGPPPDSPPLNRDALMLMETHGKSKRYKRRSSTLDVSAQKYFLDI